MTVRPATVHDLPRVAEIAAPFVRDTCVTFEEEVWDVPAWHRKLDDVAARGLPFLVAEVEGPAEPGSPRGTVVAGYAYASAWRSKPAYRHTAEDTIYLDPAHAGRGVGTALLAALLEALAAAGSGRSSPSSPTSPRPPGRSRCTAASASSRRAA